LEVSPGQAELGIKPFSIVAIGTSELPPGKEEYIHRNNIIVCVILQTEMTLTCTMPAIIVHTIMDAISTIVI
jgi:hypothetical protein